MKNKSGPGNAIIRSLTNIRRLCDLKAKRPRTDGAKEQNTKELQKFLDNNGASTGHKAPNANQWDPSLKEGSEN